MGIPTSGFIH